MHYKCQPGKVSEICGHSLCCISAVQGFGNAINELNAYDLGGISGLLQEDNLLLLLFSSFSSRLFQKK